MASQLNLFLNRGNDETVNLALQKADGSAYDLTAAVVEMYIKPSALTPDTDTRVIKLSTATGEISITDAPNGLAQAVISASSLQIPVGKFWRADIVAGSTRHTAIFGTLATGYR